MKPTHNRPSFSTALSRYQVTATVPRPFDFGLAPDRPLVPLAVATVFLNLDTAEILRLVDDGSLQWAFDVRCAKSRRREIRIFRGSLLECGGLVRRASSGDFSAGEDFPGVADKIVPAGKVLSPADFLSAPPVPSRPLPSAFHHRLRLSPVTVQSLVFPREPVLPGTELAHCLACCPKHVLDLMREQSLSAVNIRRGVKDTPLILRGSVVEFLAKRRVA